MSVDTAWPRRVWTTLTGRVGSTGPVVPTEDAVDWPTTWDVYWGRSPGVRESAPRGAQRRAGRLSAAIERISADRWHATITVMQSGCSVRDDSVPVIDLGDFPNPAAAGSAADLVIRTWSWAS